MLTVRQRRAALARQFITDAIAEIGEHRIADWLDVHVSTVRRWAEGSTKVPRSAITAIEAHRGRLPGMETRQWEGWAFGRDGKLCAPDGREHSAGSILAQQYERALIKNLQATNKELADKLARATTGYAANDGDLTVILKSDAG